MANFLGEHIGTIVQFMVTVWFAKIARDFQVTMSVYGTRLDTAREAVRRARVLWWMEKDDPNQVATLNEMMDWHAVNEVYLTETAARAFMDVHQWKGLRMSIPVGPGMGLQAEFKKAQQGLDTLRAELLRFRKRPLGDLLLDWARNRFRGKAAPPTAKPAPPA